MKSLGLLLLVVAAVAAGILVGRNVTEDPVPGGGSEPSGAPAADLAILSATVERVAHPDDCGGYDLCLVVTVANWGPEDVTGLNDGCGTSSFGDPQPWSNYTFNSALPAGATVTFRSGYENLEPFLPATFTLFCEVDAVGRIDESNEDNNRYTTEVSL
jgi:hypothetical protein